MLTVNIDPVLFRFLGFEIRYYGIVYSIGILLIYYFLKKKKILDENELEKFMLYLTIGMLIGARLLGIMSQDFFILFEHPLEFFKIWNGGMSFFGGFLGALIGSHLALKKKLFEVADLVVLPLTFSLFLGRIANFLNQELVGTVADFSWCFNFATAEGCRHPYQLYAAFSHLFLFGFLYFKSRRNYRRGELFFIFIAGYGLLRFITDFFRDNFRIFGLTGWQYVSILFFIVGIFYIFRIRNRNTSNER